jgi:hypothetical protein
VLKCFVKGEWCIAFYSLHQFFVKAAKNAATALCSIKMLDGLLQLIVEFV